jgi:hypothetical protein
MHDRIYPMVLQDAIQRGAVSNVALDERGSLAGNFFDAVNDDCRAVSEVVEQNGMVAGIDQLHAGMRTNVAGSARQQYGGHRSPCRSVAERSRCVISQLG